MGRYYNRQGEEISQEVWMTHFGDAEYSVVRKDQFQVGGSTVEISTVWLGLNHRYGEGPPLIFETMTFGTEDEEQYRYSTEEEALAGHMRLVEEFQILRQAVT